MRTGATAPRLLRRNFCTFNPRQHCCSQCHSGCQRPTGRSQLTDVHSESGQCRHPGQTLPNAVEQRRRRNFAKGGWLGEEGWPCFQLLRGENSREASPDLLQGWGIGQTSRQSEVTATRRDGLQELKDQLDKKDQELLEGRDLSGHEAQGGDEAEAVFGVSNLSRRALGHRDPVWPCVQCHCAPETSTMLAPRAVLGKADSRSCGIFLIGPISSSQSTGADSRQNDSGSAPGKSPLPDEPTHESTKRMSVKGEQDRSANSMKRRCAL